MCCRILGYVSIFVGLLGLGIGVGGFLFVSNQDNVNFLLSSFMEYIFHGRFHTNGHDILYDDGLHVQKMLKVRKQSERILSDKSDFILPKDGFIEDHFVTMRDEYQNIVRIFLNQKRKRKEDLVPALLWIHGGGFCIGKYYQNDNLLVELTEKAGIVAFAIQYRLAPEHGHPKGVEDVMDHLSWIRKNALRFGVDPNRLMVGGASAGGNLAAVAALLSRDQKDEAPLKLQILVGPITDVQIDKYPSYQLFASGYGLTRQIMIGFLSCYLGTNFSLVTDPTAAPIHGNLESLPPSIIVINDADVLQDEGRSYALALKKAGNDVTFLELAGLHCSVLFPFFHSQQRATFIDTVVNRIQRI